MRAPQFDAARSFPRMQRFFDLLRVGNDDVLPVAGAYLLERPHECSERAGGWWDVEDEEAAELELWEQPACRVLDATDSPVAGGDEGELRRRLWQPPDASVAVRVVPFCGLVGASV